MNAINIPPFSALLGITFEHVDGAAIRATLPQSRTTIGAPHRLHGGAVASLLEAVAFAALHDVLADPRPQLKPITMTVDYLREGALIDSYAEAEIVRLGRRIANIRVTAWQDDRARPIATAQINMLLDQTPPQTDRAD